MEKTKQKDGLKYFYENYKPDFLKLLHTPILTVTKIGNVCVPYEYHHRKIFYKRNIAELDEKLPNELYKLALYMFEHHMSKDLMITVAGGNMYGYWKMKQSFEGTI